MCVRGDPLCLRALCVSQQSVDNTLRPARSHASIDGEQRVKDSAAEIVASL